MRSSIFTLALAMIFACALLVSASGADEWSSFRAGDGKVDEVWDPAALEGAAPLWTVNVGEGYSASSLAGGKLYTAGYVGGEDKVSCLDPATGKELWSFKVKGKDVDYAGTRGTPVVDGGKVYYFGLKGGLYCLDAATGKKLWENAIAAEAKAGEPGWGFASSVLIEGDLVLVNIGATGAAVNKATGTTAWKTAGGVSGYATPVAFTYKGARYAAFFSQKTLAIVEVKTGKKFASITWETDCEVNAADPLVIPGDRIFISSGYGRGCSLWQIGAKGLTKLWENKGMAAHFSSPIYHDGALIGVDGNAGWGELVSLDAKTGKVIWKEGTGFGGFIAAGDKIVLAVEHGSLVVCALNAKKYVAIASFDGLAERIVWTAPVIAGGRLYLRSNGGDLVCYDVGKK